MKPPFWFRATRFVVVVTGWVVSLAVFAGLGVLIHVNLPAGRTVTAAVLDEFLTDFFQGSVDIQGLRAVSSNGLSADVVSVYDVYGNRVLDRGPLTQMWLRTHEKHLRMRKYAFDSYKCGLYAVDQVAQYLVGDTYSRSGLLRTPSKPTGFSLKDLQVIALSHGIGLVAVNREMSSDLVVPSVVHWQLNHYAAIIRQRGDYYEVVDPSTGGPMWLTEEYASSFLKSVCPWRPGRRRRCR